MQVLADVPIQAEEAKIRASAQDDRQGGQHAERADDRVNGLFRLSAQRFAGNHSFSEQVVVIAWEYMSP
ncbi:MAG: hypothetical protein P8Z40_08110 [Chloroflexota bacterium]